MNIALEQTEEYVNGQVGQCARCTDDLMNAHCAAEECLRRRLYPGQQR